MIRFCVGSVFKLLSLCKISRKYSDDLMCETLFPMSYNKGYAGHIKDCSKNLPDDVRDFRISNTADIIFSDMTANVEKLIHDCIDPNKHKLLVLALREIICGDTSLERDVILGYDPNYKKETLSTQTSFLLTEFVTNILIFLMAKDDNAKEKASIKNLNKDYLTSLETRLNEIYLLHNTVEDFFLPTATGDDFLLMYEMPREGHTVGFYESFVHTWRIKNSGATAWKNRILTYANALDTRIRISSDTPQPICVPDLKPGEDTKLSVEFDARGFEGTHEVIFEIKNEDGTPCFSHKKEDLRFEVTVKNNIN